MDDDAARAARQERAQARTARMLITRSSRDAEVAPTPVYGAEGIALAAQLSRMAWSMSGGALPANRTRPVLVSFRPRTP